MKHLRKLFGGISMRWPRVILFAVGSAVWSAVLLLLPVDLDVAGMGSTFPWWILFALIIISNCEKPLEAACKTFVFFLISQPLIYLFQVPFSEMGWDLFMYYPPWFLMTLLTFPGAWIGWHVRKKGILSGVILSPMIFICAECGKEYLEAGCSAFPRDLLSLASGIFCIAECAVLLIFLLSEPKQRIAAALCTAVLMLGTAWFYSAVPECSTVYQLPDDIRKEDIAEIKVADPSLIRVSPETESLFGDDADCYLLIDAMKAECSSEFTLYGKDGQVLLTCTVVSERRPDSNPENKRGYYQTVEVTEKES
ncbi:MAG: hypothetical protein IKX57_02515 [Oscillospiraceae bacterium]|nr:hypothetical protein [Oscillospiraceae bacterium]